MLFVGIDPGFSHMGVVILDDKLHIVRHALITTLPGKDRKNNVFKDDISRYRTIYTGIDQALSYLSSLRDETAIMAIESYSPFGQRGTQGSKVIGVIGMLLTIAFQDPAIVDIMPYTPAQSNTLLPKGHKDIVNERSLLLMEKTKVRSQKRLKEKERAIKKLLRKQLLAEVLCEKIPELKNILDQYALSLREHISDACGLAYRGLIDYKLT